MQKIIYASHSREALEDALSGCRKFLLVCGSSLHGTELETYINALPVPHVRFSGFTPNPIYEDMRDGVNLFREEGCDSIVAIGGGSAMDVAKCIKLFCRMNPEQNYLRQPYQDTGIPLVAFPTTAGTGSESTHFAVIYCGGQKKSVAHDSLLPNIAILDPDVLKTLPIYLKKCTALDALCHGIESWWSLRSTDESRNISAKAVTGIIDHLDAYLAGEESAAGRILIAANLAGQAINLTTTTAAHAMCYKLTSLYGLPHGHAAALCLPRVWEYLLAHPERCVDPRGSEMLLRVLSEISHAFGAATLQESPKAFDALLDRLDIRFPEGQGADDLELLSNSVNVERLGNSPVSLDAAALKSLYEQIVHIKGA